MSGDINELERLFEHGKALLAQQRFEEAAEVLKTVAAQAPGDGATRILLAVSCFNAGDYAGALTPAAVGTYIAPSNVDAHTVLGESLRHLGRPEDAARHLARAAWLGSGQAAALLSAMDKAACPRCGSDADPGAECLGCAGKPPPTSDPRPRTWLWAHLGGDDYRSRLALPAEELTDLGCAYVTRYRENGDADAIEDGILYLQLAAATHDEHDRVVTLTELGVAYRLRFTCHAMPADLDYAIDCHEQALSLAAPQTADQALVLGNMGIAYAERYRLGGLRTDLDRGIAVLERGLDMAAKDQETYVPLLANAGDLLRERFRRDRTPADLDRAIWFKEEVVQRTPADHARLAGRLSNFAVALVERSRHSGDPADLLRAADLAERAVQETPAGHPARPVRLANWGSALLYLCDHAPDPANLAIAISALRQAYTAAPEGSPAAIGLLGQLLETYLRPGADRSGVDREQLHAFAELMATATNAPVRDRVRAGRAIGAVANAVGAFDIAAEVLDATIALLPTIAARGAGWADRDHRAAEYTGLVSHAVTAHCARGDLVGAVQIAELGRGLQLAEQLDARSDLTELEQHLPEYAQAFGRVRTLMNGPDGAATQVQAPIWTRYQDLLAQIRGHRGFERFLLPPDLPELQRASAGGTVVMVNGGRDRADAVLIPPGGALVHVPLPDLKSRHLVAYQDALLTVTRAAGRPAKVAVDRDLLPMSSQSTRIDLSDILAWLWDAVVGPIHAALRDRGVGIGTGAGAGQLRAGAGAGFGTGAVRPPERVWWLPIGAIGAFPLHAAGDAGDAGRPGALDAFVSSYIPTLRVLAHAHGRRAAGTRRQLTVAVADVPGLPTIPGTITEARSLYLDHPELPPLLDGEATVGRVKSALPGATWAHFACHAGADYDVPSNSGLHLADGVLTVPEISRLGLTDAELAYLSACSTAHRSGKGIDESVNLASAFHLAGFRHVVASLWPLNDTIAAQIAREFYTQLAEAPDSSAAPAALRRVTLDVRGRHPDRPDLWAGLVHSGP